MRTSLRLQQSPPEDDPDEDFFARHGTELFHDQHDKPFIRLRVGNHLEAHPLRGKWVRNAVIRWAAVTSGRHLTCRNAKNLIDFAEAFASENVVELSNRSGWGATADELLVDLADDEWRAVRVSRSDAGSTTADATFLIRPCRIIELNFQNTLFVP